MADTTPPPQKSGGSSPFIIAALAMLALMAGLIVWKVRSADDDVKRPEPAALPPPGPTAADEPPPPPPPPVVETPDAGKDTAPKQPVRSGATAGCAGQCAGEATAALQAALRAKAGQARGCYERALRQNSMLQGRMLLSLRVGAFGQVCSASVVSNELGDPGVGSCVLQMFRGANFPSPQKGCVDMQVPLNFQPKS